MAYKNWLCKFLTRGGMSIINRIRRDTGKVVKVVSTGGNHKAKSGGMGRDFRIEKDLNESILSRKRENHTETPGGCGKVGRFATSKKRVNYFD